MIRSLLSACAFVFLMSLPALASEVPLKQVTLSTAGLAQFEHRGSVSGNKDLALPVRLDQVDDVLKSLVVLDPAGAFHGVSLPGREPVETIFRDLPFDQDALRAPERLLSALQGAEVSISTGAEVLRGRLVSVTAEQSITRDQQVVRRHRVAVMTPEGLKTTLLEDARAMKFADASVQAQLDRGLAALFQNRVQDQRVVTLNLRGEGTREVGLSYVTEAPMWKTAYRLVVDRKDDAKAYLQGWAILENTTGQDWNEIEVTLLSSNPVTYRQALYESYYLDRPFLPLRVMDRLMPRTDEGAMVMPTAANLDGGGGAMRKAARMEPEMMASAAPASPIMTSPIIASPMTDGVASDMGGYAGGASATMAALPAATAQTALGSGMVFTFPGAVTIPAGSSMMLPIIARDIPAEQIWLYQPDTHPRHPLAAVSLYNDTQTGLPPGIFTLFEQTEGGLRYSGDAELATMPAGETRLVTFALDPATKIDRAIQSERVYGTFTAAKGVLRQNVVSTESTTYTIAAPDEEDRTIVIEHPRRPGWDLKNANGAYDVEQTDTHYRVKIQVDAGAIRKVPLTLTRSEAEILSLSSISADAMMTRIAAVGKDLPESVRTALEGVIPLQRDLATHQATLQRLDQQRQQIYNDQVRVRGNLQSIPSGSDLAKRYLSELNAQEDELKKINASYGAAEKKLNEARAKLETYVAGLAF